MPGSGVTLPLDLQAIAARCTNAYYAPKRFAAVQLAFSNDRCRVLVFRKPVLTTHTHTHTPFHSTFFPTALVWQTRAVSSAQVSASLVPHRPKSRPAASVVVVPGCSGPMAARLAILKAARQLAVEAGVHVTIRNFQVSQSSCRTCALLVHSMSIPSPSAQVINQACRMRFEHVRDRVVDAQSDLGQRDFCKPSSSSSSSSSAKLDQLVAGSMLQIVAFCHAAPPLTV